MAQRIKGQEVSLLLVEDNVPLVEITTIRSLEVAALLEILTEGYLGETTDRRDSVYRGYRGSIDIHFESREPLDFMRRLVDKARRRTAGARVNCKATFNIPGSDRVRVLLKDLAFGEIPIGFGGRAEYGTIGLSFEGEDFSLV